MQHVWISKTPVHEDYTWTNLKRFVTKALDALKDDYLPENAVKVKNKQYEDNNPACFHHNEDVFDTYYLLIKQASGHHKGTSVLDKHMIGAGYKLNATALFFNVTDASETYELYQLIGA